MRAPARIAVTLLGTVTLIGGCEQHSRPAEKRPDILLVSIDSLRHDHLGCYGYEQPTSPTIDRLAAEGVRFANAISTTSWTLPAHVAMMTGLYDTAHGVVDNGLRLADAHVTLAEVFSEAGYATAGFFGGPYLHPTFGFAQGFETYENCMTPLLKDVSEEEIRAQSRRPDSVSHIDVAGPRTLEKFSAWLNTADDRPFFAFVHLWDVHYDYAPPAKYVEMFDPGYAGDVTATDFMGNKGIHPDMPERDLRHIVALYDGEIRFTDEIVGRLLLALERRGRLQNTLIVVTSDHGEEFFEHGGKGHQRTLYDELVRVPLIFHWPAGLEAGITINDQVSLIDLMPTLLSLAKIPLNFEVQGRDLSPALRGATLAAAPAFCELFVERNKYRALRTLDFKIVHDGNRDVAAWFDLRSDPTEDHPILELDDRAHAALARLKSMTQECLALLQRRGHQAGDARPSEEIEQKLRTLGYVGERGDDTSANPRDSGATSRPGPP